MFHIDYKNVIKTTVQYLGLEEADLAAPAMPSRRYLLGGESRRGYIDRMRSFAAPSAVRRLASLRTAYYVVLCLTSAHVALRVH